MAHFGHLGERMLSFVVPAHNEEHLLRGTLEAIHSAAAKTGQPYEVIVVDLLFFVDADTRVNFDVVSDAMAAVRDGDVGGGSAI